MTASKRLPTAERQRQIAEAALSIISTQGVRRMTTVALAREVGITDGAIFRHFKNKEEIVEAAIDLFEAALEGTFPSPDGEPLARLGAFLVNRLTLVRKHPELLRLAFNDRLAEAAGQQGADRVAQIVGRSMAFVHECLAEAQSKGEITSKTPVMLLVWMTIGVIRGASSNHPNHRLESHIPGSKNLATAPPKEVWATLENFLRNSAKEPKR